MRGGISVSQKTWFTAAELADLDLPGLSSKRNRMVEIVAAGRWAERYDAAGESLSRKRAGRGGGLEFHHSVLPVAAVQRLAQLGYLEAPEGDLKAPLSAPEEVANDVSPWAWFEAQPDKVKDEAQARLKAVQAVEAGRRAGLGQNAAVAQAATEHGVSAATLWNWLKLLSGVATADRLPALAPRRKGGGVKADMDPRVFETFKSYFLTPVARTYAASWFYTQRWAKGEGLTVPNVKTLQRRLEREVPREVIVLKRQGIKALMEMVPSQTRSVADMHAMQLVNIDGHTIDVFVAPPGGGDPMRATLIGMQDVYSRKMVAWRMCGEESIFHTRLCFADLFAKWGLPEHVYMDNGRAFASKYLTGGTKTRFRYVVKETDPWGLLPALGIKNTFATPEHGQAKPIERGFGDLVKFIAKHPACEGAYTGNRTDRKPHDYGSKVMVWEELSAIVDEMIGEYNAFAGRRTEMGGGEKSFDQVFYESRALHGVNEATPAHLRMALLEAKTHRADAKTGEIRMHGNRYHAQELYAMAGKDVTIRFDPDNLHAPIHIYATTGQYICQADAITPVGFLNTEAAKAIARKRADFRKLARQMVEAEGLLSAAHLASMQPRPDPAEVPPVPNLVRPVRSRGHSAASALKVIADGAPAVSRSPVIDRFTSAIAAMEEAGRDNRRKFTIFDGGLAPQREPERPKK